MFNRSTFNQQPFNRSSADVFPSVTFVIAIKCVAAAGLRQSGSSQIPINLGMTATPVLVRHAKISPMDIVVKASSNATRQRQSTVLPMDMEIKFRANHYTYGTEVINLEGLTLAPGDELVIDTDLMTVTLNGENIAHLVSRDSDFLKLLAGLNTIVYQDASGQNRSANIRIEWKPRWV